MVYKLLLYIHVFSSILAIGPFFACFLIINKLQSADERQESACIGLFFSVIRMVKHAGHVLVLSGFFLMWKGGWSWKEPWIALTLIVMFSSILFLARAFTPILKEFNDRHREKNILIKKLQRTLWVYVGLLMIMLWFMITKPSF